MSYQGPILLVEDNADDALLTRRALTRGGLENEVVHARDGVEALDYLFGTGTHAGRDPGDVPVVMLLDLKLPKLDGLDVLRRVRGNEATRLLPVVILTSSQEEQDLMAGYELGANSYVVKPVEFGQFVDAVRELGLYWVLRNKRARAFPG
ncbi:response regulator [Miltoncostaea marina]|uniref:response regulator n=1 Tax=Miltoncostaea marina TaxID=2843215 RepID=UPI001C3C30D9|nr:response regulator [Miltoncostaea marina]